MNRRQQLDIEVDAALGQLVEDSAAEGGFTIHDLRAALADLVPEGQVKVHAHFAINRLRKAWGADVLVYNRRTGRYHASLTRGEALHWLATLVLQTEQRLANLHHYVGAAVEKYGTELAAGPVHRRLLHLVEAIDRARVDAQHAQEELADLLLDAA